MLFLRLSDPLKQEIKSNKKLPIIIRILNNDREFFIVR